jgi:DNA adenine methylase
MTRPFLKWVGGKRQLLDQILPELPTDFTDYYEPFLGGGAVFFALAGQRRVKATLSDSNLGLMRAYNVVRNEPQRLITALQAMPSPTEENYYKVRASKPRMRHTKAARFIWLNRTCFNGLYRENKKGAFNVPYGKYKNPNTCPEELILQASRALRYAYVCQQDALTAKWANVKAKSLVYFDPPYIPLSPTSNFTSYNAAGFGQAQQEKLASLFKLLTAKRVYAVASNSDTPLTRELYKGFRMIEVKATRRINSNANKRGTVGELLIFNY